MIYVYYIHHVVGRFYILYQENSPDMFSKLSNRVVTLLRNVVTSYEKPFLGYTTFTLIYIV